MATRAQLIADLKSTLATYFATANALIKAKPKSAKLSDNATTLTSTDRAGLLSPTSSALATHASNVSNPHGLTAAKVSAPTKTEVESALANKLLAGALPLSRFGAINTTALPIAAASSGFVLNFTAAIPAVLNGTQYSLVAQSLDLTTVDSAPANKTFYLYLALVNGTAVYKASASLLPESYTSLYLGKLVCGASVINTVTVDKVTRLGNYRVSTTPVGSAIPAVTGHPATATTLPTSWKS